MIERPYFAVLRVLSIRVLMSLFVVILFLVLVYNPGPAKKLSLMIKFVKKLARTGLRN